MSDPLEDLHLAEILLRGIPSDLIAEAIEHRQDMKREALTETTTYTDYLERYHD